MRWVAHLRLTEFLTVLAREGPGVPKGRDAAPLAVVQDGVVLEASPAAAAAGVVPGDPEAQAARRCPGLVRVAHDPVRAREAALAVWDICARATPFVEPDGERAVFLSLGAGGRRGLAHPMSAPVEAVLRLVQAIFTERGYRVATGLAPSKLVARMASVRGGLTVVRPEEVDRFVAAAPIDALWPAPDGVRTQLRRLGVATCGELREVPEGELWRHFGRLAPDLVRWARGDDPRPVLPLYPQRTVEARLAFPDPVSDTVALRAALERLARRLARQLAAAGEGCRWLTLLVEAEDGTRHEARRRFSRPTQGAAALRAALEALARPPGPVAGLVATAGDLRPALSPQGDLFTTPAEVSVAAAGGVPTGPTEGGYPGSADPHQRGARWERATAVMEALDRRYGARTAVLAGRLPVSRRERLLAFWDPLRAGPSRAGRQR